MPDYVKTQKRFGKIKHMVIDVIITSQNLVKFCGFRRYSVLVGLKFLDLFLSIKFREIVLIFLLN